MREGDTNRDGVLSYDEFAHIFNQLTDMINGAAAKEALHPGYHSDIGVLGAGGTAAYSHIRPMWQLDELYDRLKAVTVGQGGQGAVVTAVQRSSGKECALKLCLPDEWCADRELALRMLLAQVELQSLLDHPNIAAVLDCFVDREKHAVSFVMPLFAGGSMETYLQNHPHLGEQAMAALVKKMLSALHHCHQHGV
eukprot:4943184-Prymnesium_polylepis.2